LKKVRFYNADRVLVLKDKKILRDFVEVIFKEEGKALLSIDYIFCSDEYLLKINKDFLQHDYFTDIVTFDLSEGMETKGEVYISLDRVKENAKLLKITLGKELQRVVFHGALHLCGYKDKKKSEIVLMRQKEDYYLRLSEKRKNDSK
jgi:rRNA maturation RNase YbeY